MTKALVEPLGDAEPLEPALTRSLQLEVFVALQTFGWLLAHYRQLADPVSYHTALGVYEGLKLKVDEVTTPQALGAYLRRVSDLTRALARALDEWHSGVVP